MHKIYPPPFNKFVIFVFYGLLSIAVIVTSQGNNDCVVDPVGNATNRKIIGYVQPSIDPNTIQWQLYDYINIIVSDFNFGNIISQTTALINAKNGNKTKILVSIRNYDLSAWNSITTNGTNYGSLFNNLVVFAASSRLDGVDIEYPGMRGLVCSTWNINNDGTFVNFVQGLKATLLNITMMLTVGVNSFNTNITLNGFIDLLNIETYHYSLYAPTTNNAATTHPNSPYTIFAQAYSNWNGVGISKDKIIMGVDFGNTVQVVTNSNIMNNQSVEYNYNSRYDVKSNLPPEVASQLIPIEGYCGQPTVLYSWPWKSLSTYALNSSTCFCTTESDWTRKFDQVNYNPWLYKVFSPDTPAYYFVSYEDFSSLHDKLSLLTTGGISISNITYDDNNNSLSNYIRNNKLPPFVELPNSDSNGGTYSNSTTNTSDQKSLDKHHAGVIAGAVVGSLSFFLLLVSSLIWYRRKTLVKSKDPGSIPKSSMKSHTTTTKNVEMSSDSSPNRFAVPTTVTPVEPSGYVTAMFDFEGKEKDDLSFKKGDKIEVLERGDGPNDWWIGRINGTVGEFPGNYVKETG